MSKDMPSMRSFVLRLDKRLLSQYLLVFFAFLLMVLISNRFAGNIVSKHLTTYGEEVITASAETLETYLQGHQITFEDVVYVIEDLYAEGAGVTPDRIVDEAERELIKWSTRLHNDDARYDGFLFIYGVIDGMFITGSEWDVPADYDPAARPWYTGAYESYGHTHYSDPYIDANTGWWVMSLSKVLRDPNGNSFGVLAFDVYLSTISDYVSHMQLINKGYGVLLDSEMRFIVHPDHSVFGVRMEDVDNRSDAKNLAAAMIANDKLNAYSYTNLTGVDSVLFSRKLFNGWYIYASSPQEDYYRDVNVMFYVLSLTGLISTLVLCGILTFMHRAKAQSDEANKLKTTLLESANAMAAAEHEAHARAKSMLDATPFGCKMWDRSLNIFDCNRAVVKLFGLRDEQEFMERFYDLSPQCQPDGTPSSEKAAKYINKAFDEGWQEFKWMHQMPDGTPVPSEVTLVRVKYGEDEAVAGYIRDLREHTQMMAEIEHRNKLMSMENFTAEMLLTTETESNTDIEKLLISSMEHLGLCVDVDRVQIWKNETIGDTLHFVLRYEWLSEIGKKKAPMPRGVGYPYSSRPEWESMFMRGDCINGPLSRLPESDQAFLSAFGIKSTVIIPLFLQDRFWGLFSIDDCERERSFADEEISIFRSVSLMMASAFLHNEMGAEIQEALEGARSASRAKSDFLSNMSHEIRTPMNAILGMTELLLHEPLSRRQSDYVNDIHVSGQSLLSIINDILDMSKIEAGKLELDPVHYDFEVFLDNLSSMFKYVAEKKNINFRLETGPDLPEHLYGDDIRLRQVLTNICGNAIKFTEKGYVRLKVTRSAREANEQLLFEIKDTGKGIRKEDMKTLFNAFAQADTHKNRGVVGTGLGLAISKSFVEMMGGAITLDSEYGQGTIFTIIVPIVAGSEEGIRKKVEQKQTQTVIAPTANVLVVDDNEFNLKVACGLLGLSKIDAATAFSGKESIEMVKENDYDIVFMDHMMPEMDGIEATAAIRALGGKYENLTIVALTANAVFGAEQMFLSSGFNDFISKPIDLYDLNEALKKWLPPVKIEGETISEEGAPGEDAPIPEKPFLDALGCIDEIDGDLGLSRVEGMTDMYRITVELFYNNLVEECGNMSALLDSGNMQDFAISIHAMKSMLSTIGAMPLSGIAADMEAAAKRGEMDECLISYPELKEKLISLHKSLSAVFQNHEDAPDGA